MVALRNPQGSGYGAPDDPSRSADASDWLSLQQAACELNLSVSTVRRMIRNGRVRNRVVPRRGGFAYLIFLPNSRHARGLCEQPLGTVAPPTPFRAPREQSPATHDGRDNQIRELEQQVEHLSEALVRALRIRQKALPPGMGSADESPDDPYGRYRWLVRRKPWWSQGGDVLRRLRG